MAEIANIVRSLHEIGSFKFGEFTLQTGVKTPFYIDLRLSVSFPKLLKELSRLMWIKIDELNLKFNHLIGVPYAAVILASFMSFQRDFPSLLLRKSVKDYGTKKKIEGTYQYGDTCLLIEDVAFSGLSVFDSAKDLQKNGLIVTDAIVVIDRQQGAVDNLAANGIRLHSLFTVKEMLSILYEQQAISTFQLETTLSYIQDNFQPFL